MESLPMYNNPSPIAVAEKVFLCERLAAATNHAVHFVAVSHSEEDASQKWIEDIGGAGKLEIIIDPERELYARWGLGVVSLWHVLNPWSLVSAIRLGREDGIWNRPTESGSRWQAGGTFAVSADGTVKWGQPATTADFIPNYSEVIKALQA